MVSKKELEKRIRKLEEQITYKDIQYEEVCTKSTPWGGEFHNLPQATISGMIYALLDYLKLEVKVTPEKRFSNHIEKPKVKIVKAKKK